MVIRRASGELACLYEIGSVVITYVNKNPGSFIGGTWTQFGQGRTLIGQGTGNDGSTIMSFTDNSTGGTYNETLSIEQIPSHSHDYYSPVVQKVQAVSSGSTYGNYNKQYKIASDSKGEGKSHNNLPPYQTVYFWRRTA